MFKKLVLSCMGMMTFAALVLPATASATNDPQLTEGGTLVPTGTTVVFTATEAKHTNTEGNALFTCSTAKLTGTVKANSGSKVEWEVPKGSAIFQGTGSVSPHNNLPECTGSFGNSYTTWTTALCIRSDGTMATDEFQVNGGPCGTGGKVKFILGSTTAGACEWESNGAIKGTYTTGGSEAKLTTLNTTAGSGMTRISGGFLCPSSLQLAMTFNLETTNGTKLAIS
jgi:hypothetical protein